jgi:hypothetical protein
MEKPYKEIKSCRICGNENLTEILDLGTLSMSGVFPKNKEEKVTSGPLTLVKCDNITKPQACGLLQLKQTYDLVEMYGENYGYRSSLNRSMMDHLKTISEKCLRIANPDKNDIVLDIGSNDATLLKSYPQTDYRLMGIDPLIKKFKPFYPEHITTVPTFFTAHNFSRTMGSLKAKIITSIALFYDLESPCNFVQDVAEVLHPEGIWLFEQSYMPTMFKRNAYDTICHEHLEYYGLKQIVWMLSKANLKIVDITFNDINGGSFQIVAAHKQSRYQECTSAIETIGHEESSANIANMCTSFKEEILLNKTEIMALLTKLTQSGKKVLGYGASTKGNILLQFCNISTLHLPYIAEVNEEKYGAFTPGTYIPIISEEEAKRMKPDYYFVLPWHFKDAILAREKNAINTGAKFIFPLPQITVV